jgi:glutathione synthase/RimK-type ligase-like ATP-grasp enzyme
MVDKAKKSAYIWFSGATDVTGKKLAEALKTKCGDKKPAQKDGDLVIGWGAKTNENTNLGKVKTLNHPDNIRSNRNKLGSLELMKRAGVNVAAFVSADNYDSIGTAGSEVKLPVIGRTKYHQGGKGFWMCPTMTHVANAVKQGAQYFQNLIEIKEEYRLHTFGDKVIYAVQKKSRTQEEMAEAFIRHEMDRQKALAKKNNNNFDEETAMSFLQRQAKKFAQNGADMLVRSNRLGWKFVKVKKVDAGLEKEAIKSLKAIGLDFGAVDCCIDASGKPWIIEVNTGPGLEESTFDIWVGAFEEKINEILNPKSLAKKVAEKMTGKKKITKKTVAASGSKKEELAAKLAMAQQFVTNADEEDIDTINKVMAKVLGF